MLQQILVQVDSRNWNTFCVDSLRQQLFHYVGSHWRLFMFYAINWFRHAHVNFMKGSSTFSLTVVCSCSWLTAHLSAEPDKKINVVKRTMLSKFKDLPLVDWNKFQIRALWNILLIKTKFILTMEEVHKIDQDFLCDEVLKKPRVRSKIGKYSRYQLTTFLKFVIQYPEKSLSLTLGFWKNNGIDSFKSHETWMAVLYSEKQTYCLKHNHFAGFGCANRVAQKFLCADL